MHTHAHIHTHLYTHTHLHTPTHTHTYTHTVCPLTCVLAAAGTLLATRSSTAYPQSEQIKRVNGSELTGAS